MSGANNERTTGLRAGELEPVFRRAGVLREELERAKSERAKATLVGGFLSKNLNREVSVEVNGRAGTAVLRQESGAGRAKYYRFEVRWAETAPSPPDAQPSIAAAAIDVVAAPSAGTVAPTNTRCTTQEAVGGAGGATNVTGNAENW